VAENSEVFGDSGAPTLFLRWMEGTLCSVVW